MILHILFVSYLFHAIIVYTALLIMLSPLTEPFFFCHCIFLLSVLGIALIHL